MEYDFNFLILIWYNLVILV